MNSIPQPSRVPKAAIEPYWEEFSEGLQSALDYSGNYRTLEEIRECLDEGRMVLWVVEGLGCCTTELMETPEGVYCNIPFLYSKDPRVDIHGPLLELLEEVARAEGLVGIKFISQRPGYGRKMKKYGFKPGFVEYRKQW